MRSEHDRKKESKQGDGVAKDATLTDKDASVGDALRAVYSEAVAENVPDEMLDLLNKLG